MQVIPNRRQWSLWLVAVGLVVVAGCRRPMGWVAEQSLREQVLASTRAYLETSGQDESIGLTRRPSEVDTDLSDERRERLDRMGGPSAYKGKGLKLGKDLVGDYDSGTVAMSLKRAVKLAVQNNLDVHFAQLQPAITRTQITQAEAAFDAVLFGNYNHQDLDTPQPPTIGGLETFGSVQDDTRQFQTGIRKPLTTGGQLQLSTQFGRSFRNPSFFDVESFYDASVEATLTQPLARGFGQDVVTAQISLARNARQESVEDLRGQLLTTVFQIEQTYWDLVFSRQLLQIRQRLLDRTVADRDQLKERENYDVSPVRLTEANSFVELRRADVIRSRQQVRSSSDQLKRLMNSPELPVTGEVLIVPLDHPADLPMSYSFVDAVTTALRERPELRRALLEINDASIRQRVADNLRLPLLDLAATVRFNSIGDDVESSYDNLDADFIDYLLAVQFEVPIGNRAAQGAFRQQKLIRQQAVVNYQSAAQQVILEVKQALRDLHTAYELIGATRAARRSAADNLRAIEEQEEAGVALTPEFLLDLKLSTQQRLANAEIQEIQALTDYNSSVARFFQITGTLLDRNGITFADPEASY